jgi:hypothetical protein
MEVAHVISDICNTVTNRLSDVKFHACVKLELLTNSSYTLQKNIRASRYYGKESASKASAVCNIITRQTSYLLRGYKKSTCRLL